MLIRSEAEGQATISANNYIHRTFKVVGNNMRSRRLKNGLDIFFRKKDNHHSEVGAVGQYTMQVCGEYKKYNIYKLVHCNVYLLQLKQYFRCKKIKTA